MIITDFHPVHFLCSFVFSTKKHKTTMDKSTHFFGNSVFGQLISFIDSSIISRNSYKCHSDHYIKKFATRDHLISMLFYVFAKCSSLREVSGAKPGFLYTFFTAPTAHRTRPTPNACGIYWLNLCFRET